MKIALSTDHAGFEQLQYLQNWLVSHGYECINFGPSEYNENDDYPDFIRPAAEAVANGQCDLGIIFGGSGQGEAIVANRVKGVRCGVFYGPIVAVNPLDAEGNAPLDGYEVLRLNRKHNHANMLSLAGRFLDDSTLINAVTIWLDTKVDENERHVRRIKKIDA
jgi:ribose 5-phosphate isomerase B